MQYKSYRPSGSSMIWGIIVSLLVIIAIYYAVTGIWTLLKWAAPVLLIATAVLKFQVITDYARGIGKLLERSPLIGILAALLSVVASPFVVFYLFLKALQGNRKPQTMNDEPIFGNYNPYEEAQKQSSNNKSKIAEKEEYITYEEVPLENNAPRKEAEPITIKVTSKEEPAAKKHTQRNDYEQMFED